ncbi:hypothetical protein BCV72DRAFT_261602 [Rhizopus microsporus var. microsporus]|uniref:Uncharacterized protein n=1 Tax=Rhizopus microsporus var. microsporus TaxID=86635 RepID=A0A1X0R8L4_RHIZD|nr:hypothetical protein BCV72DRAFT_261602 [Rhizopus microsporus var. microsporus]
MIQQSRSQSSRKDGQSKETVAKDDKFTSELPVIAFEENDVVISTLLLNADDIYSSFTTINDLDFEQTDEDEFNDDKTDNGVSFATNEEQDSTQGDNEDVDDVVTKDDSNEAQNKTSPSNEGKDDANEHLSYKMQLFLKAEKLCIMIHIPLSGILQLNNRLPMHLKF